MISTFVQGMKARNLIPKPVPQLDAPEWVRHYSLYPWRPTRLPPVDAGTPVLAPVWDKEKNKDVLARGVVVERRRGWAKNLSNELMDDSPVAAKEVRFDLKAPPFTRDQAGLYMVRLESGRMTFAHGSELIPDSEVAA